MGQTFPTDPVLTTHEYRVIKFNVVLGDLKSPFFSCILEKKYFPRPVRSIILKKLKKEICKKASLTFVID